MATNNGLPDDAPAAASLPAALRAAHSNEVALAQAEIHQARELLGNAVRTLMTSFHQLSHDTKAQRDQVAALLRDMNDAEGGASNWLNLPSFVQKTTDVLEGFASVLVRFSKQSVRIAYQIDDMIEHIDAIFHLVSEVDGIAEETNILAINAALEAARAGELGRGFGVVASEVRGLSRSTKKLNEAIGARILGARATMDQVREAVREIASQDMTVALEAKGGVDSMLDQLHSVNTEFGSALGRIGEFTKRVEAGTDEAVRGLQFEDMVGQLLNHLQQRVDHMDSIVSASGPPAATVATGESPLRKSGPVTQQSMDAGGVELF